MLLSFAKALATRVPAVARLRRSRDALLVERDALSGERRILLGERDSLSGERDALSGERDALRVERDALSAELDRAAAWRPDVGSPFFHYNTTFDAQEVMHRHAVRGLQPHPDYLTNFLGVRIDPRFFPGILGGRAGQVEPVPIPANWHADIAEWGAVLRAVDLARGTFTVAELGCGWGCWLNNAGAAARRAGLAVRLVGIEADEDHLGFAREACAANGFPSSDVSLRRGVAAATAGVALFPRQDHGGTSWGSEPIFGAAAEQRAEALRLGSHDEVTMVALDDLLAPHPRVDLLHVDIQGGEVALVEDC